MGRGLLRLTLSIVLVSSLTIGLSAAAQANHKPRFQLIRGLSADGTFFGTTRHDKDPLDPRNHVIAIDTTDVDGSGLNPAGIFEFGAVRRTLNTKISALDEHLEVSYFFSGRSCGGGSPRIQLAIDTDGNGVSNGNAFGYIGPPPNFVGCVQNQWVHEDLTLSVLEGGALSVSWDLTQFAALLPPGTIPAFVITWDLAKQIITTFFPSHRVLRGSLVDDSSWCGPPQGCVPTAAGLAFYDDITIGYLTLYEASDTIGN